MARNKQYEAEQAAAGWHALGMLIDHVQRGLPPVGTAPTILCRPGEEQYGTFAAAAQIHCGADVEYSSGMFAAGGLLFTAAALATSAAVNASNRRKAEAASRPQWRSLGQLPVIVTNQRLLLLTEQWTSYGYAGLLMVQPDPMSYGVVLHFEGAYPLMLHGPWVPWATVLICATMFRRPWPPGYVPPPQLQIPPQAQLPAPTRQLPPGGH
jgi:hypothetical protein